MKLSNLIYLIRSKIVGTMVMIGYGLRGVFNPFTSSGRQFFFYRLLRLGVDQADRIDINIPGTGKKKPGELEGPGSRRKPLSYKGLRAGNLGFKNLRDQLLGNADNETYPDNENTPRSSQYRSKKQAKKRTEKVYLDPQPEEADVDQELEELASETETIPLLTHHREIQGRRGRYRIQRFLGQRGRGRMYRASQTTERESVIIREYVLPNHIFNQREIAQRKQEFERLTGINLFDGKARDFRLIGVFEAVADEHENRCYLVTKGETNFGTTLRDYLQDHGPFSDWQVHKVIKQVLQSLEFLHSHKFRLGTSHLQRGLIHNNLCLDSLLCTPHDTEEDGDTLSEDFFVYVTDLGVWDNLFVPSTSSKFESSMPNYKPEVDLYDLGRLGFYLALGEEIDEETGLPHDPRNKHIWPDLNPELKEFMLRLMGQHGNFADATSAWLALPPDPQKPFVLPVDEPEKAAAKKPSKWKRRILWFLGGLLTFVLLGVIGWLVYLFVVPKAIGSSDSQNPPTYLRNISEVNSPEGKFNYASQQNDIWNYILKHPNLVSLNKSLEQVLAERVAQFQLTYKAETSLDASLKKLKDRQLAFVVSTLPENQSELGKLDEFGVETIAYDGLAIFVSFSDANRNKNLALALNGQITFEQLRQLYTGKITNWQQLGGPDLPVKLYVPSDPRLVQQFEERVFAGHPEELERFRKQLLRMQPTGTTQTLRSILNDFEVQDTGGIGFDALSKVFGQCSVYPLAVARDKEPAIQPISLSADTHQPLNPRFDLCDNKGSYWMSPKVFRGASVYPLMSKISVIFPRDSRAGMAGSSFAAIFSTQEGQELLQEAGLVPLFRTPQSVTPSTPTAR